MKTLLILRHAKSSWSDATLADHDRPLNGRGRHDAPRMGDLLAMQELTPDIIITSSARRAVQTAKLVADESGYEGKLVVTRSLYHGDAYDYLEAAREHGGDSNVVMVLGHNPGIEELVEQLTGTWQRMPTAALAEVRLDSESWAALDDDTTGRLNNLWLPKELPD